MSSKLFPDRHLRADVLASVLQSRRVLAGIFTVFLAGGVCLIVGGGNVHVSLGTSLVASALISLATLLIDQIRNGEQMRAADLAKAGMLTVYERRDLPEYDALVRVSDEIDVAGYTLRSFSESNEETIRARAEAKRPVKLRVILVDPASEAARLMEAAERMPSGSYEANRAALVARLGGIDGVEIRLLTRHLSMMIYRIDDVLYTGPFPQHASSKVALTFKLGRGGWLFDKQHQEFLELWKQASPVAIDA